MKQNRRHTVRRTRLLFGDFRVNLFGLSDRVHDNKREAAPVLVFRENLGTEFLQVGASVFARCHCLGGLTQTDHGIGSSVSIF